MQIGTSLPTIMNDQVPDVAVMTRHLEDLGFDSVDVPDLIIGDGTPALEAPLVLAAAASVSTRIRLGFSVLSLPLRPTALVAAQVATLQHLSGNRLLLGIGIGGFPGSPFWNALGAPVHGRGRETDAALEAIPGLVTGRPTRVGGEEVTLGPPAKMPPILVGGNSEAAMRRAATYGDGWVPSLITEEDLAGKAVRLRELAEERGRPVPAIHVGGHATLVTNHRAREAFIGNLVEMHGMSREQAEKVAVAGGPAQVAERLAAYGEAGAQSVGFAFDGGDWMREAELFAEARAVSRPGS